MNSYLKLLNQQLKQNMHLFTVKSRISAAASFIKGVQLLFLYTLGYLFINYYMLILTIENEIYEEKDVN